MFVFRCNFSDKRRMPPVIMQKSKSLLHMIFLPGEKTLQVQKADK